MASDMAGVGRSPSMAEFEIPQSVKTAPARRPQVRRSRSDRVVAGVAAGVARHLGVEPLVVRLAFAAFALAAGFGVVVYLLLWLLAPIDAVDAATGPEPVIGRALPRPTRRQLFGVSLILAGMAILFLVTGLWFGWELGWPASLAAIGFAVLWARGSDDGRTRWDPASFRSPFEAVVSGRVSLPRILLGSALILGGMAVFLAATTSLSAAANVVLAVLVTIGGLALLGGPWIWRLANQLMDERNSRIRSEARAEMAAHLHDSVLQTLALIQRSQEPREMASLARTQERELRAWLFGRAPSVRGATLRDAVDVMAGRVELSHQVRVEAIVVGDVELDDALQALVAACTEATLNAATHSGVDEVSVYVEVEDGVVSAFVRDEGIGFDPSAVGQDRRGIAESIIGRMERHGGSAQIRSEHGHGTEVVLRLPRPDG
jgi:signal transduction histidine kinase/phage shock protein PspC (stress-responsive transcriptional regulator)